MRLYLRLVTLEAARALARNAVRSLLAILGIAVAVTTVIWVAAIGHAGVKASEAQLEALGDNLLWIEAGSRSVNGVRTGSHGMTTLTARDAQAIRDEISQVSRTSENVDGRIQVIGNGRNWLTGFRGVSPDYQQIKRWDLAAGEFFSDDDVDKQRTVIVIGETVRDKLFGDDPALGEQMRVGGHWFTIIGILAPKGQSATGQDQDDTVMMPWTTAMKRLVGKDQTWLDDVLCSVASPDDMAAATAQVSALLRERHHLGPNTDDDFNIRKPQELLEARIKSSRTLERLMVILATIALVVGGVGIMNVMLASVGQRTREVGIRAAVGATPGAIQAQFLAEAMLLAATGATIGLVVAVTCRSTLEGILGWPMALSTSAAVAAVVAAVASGAAFGFYPAWRASRLDPIAALHDPQ